MASNGDGRHLPFVDGLRAVAIVSVVAFHVSPSVLPGGYLGVDIFFVISGFLILGQTARLLNEGRFSALEFIARRFLRIIPPLAVVLLACLVGARFFPITPTEHADLVKASQAASTFWANFHYWKGINYFNPISDLKPLLHTWSLSVEEQFYAATAAIALVLALLTLNGRRASKIFLGAIALVGAASAGLYFVGAYSPEAKFYRMPFRVWEFAIGGLAAAVAHRRDLQIGTRRAHAIMLASAAGICLAISFGTDLALPVAVVCTGAALAIGTRALSGFVSRILSYPASQFIGRISYSWYLWHWPAIFAARSLDPAGNSITPDLLGAGVSFLLAVATYYTIERPVVPWRHAHRSPVQSALAAGAGLALIAPALAMASLTNTTNDSAARAFKVHSRHAHVDYETVKRSKTRIYKVGSGAASSTVIWGDSQARHLLPAISAIAESTDSSIELWASGGCPPIFGEANVSPNNPHVTQRCARYRDEVQKWIESDTSAIQTVILIARWPAYWGRMGGETFVELLRETVLSIRSHGKRVILFAPLPDFPFRTPDCVYRADWLGETASDVCRTDRASFEFAREPVVTLFKNMANEDPEGISIVDAAPEFCPDEFCTPIRDGRALYADFVHLNRLGSTQITSVLTPYFPKGGGVLAASTPPP